MYLNKLDSLSYRFAEYIGRISAARNEAAYFELERAFNTACLKAGYNDLINVDLQIPAVTESAIKAFQQGVRPADFEGENVQL